MQTTKLNREVSNYLQSTPSCYIDGMMQQGEGAPFTVVNPATDTPLVTLKSASRVQVERAMTAAKRALHDWQNIPTLERGVLLLKLADKVIEQRDTLAQLESICSGKTIQLARTLEIDQSVAFLRYFAGWAGKFSGETLDVSLPSSGDEKYTAFTRRRALGVVVAIIPWNFSIMIAVWKLAAALVCGCTVVVKPSEYTPLTLLKLSEMATECGFPPGVVNVVNGPGQELGPALTEHPACAKVSFTGSVATGRAVSQAASAQAKHVTLELGGKNSALFMDDFSVEEIVNGILEAGYLNQGQICAAAECFWIPEKHIDAVMGLLTERLTAMVPGDPLDEDTQLGPLANKAQLNKIMRLLDVARAEGDEIICGGEAFAMAGYYLKPTAVRVASVNSTLMKEETFGPVGSFIAYRDAESALRQINQSPFGLAASVWSHNLSHALRFSERLEAGMVWVNMHTLLDPAVPFGGMKGSGMGREFGSAFIEDYTVLKSVMVRY